MNFDDLSSGDLEPPKKSGLFSSILGGAKNLIQRSLSRSRVADSKPSVLAVVETKQPVTQQYQKEQYAIIPAKLLVAFEQVQRGQMMHNEEQDRKIAELRELVKAMSDENKALKDKADVMREKYVEMAKNFGNQTMVLKMPTLKKESEQTVVAAQRPTQQPNPAIATSESTTQPEQPKKTNFTFGAALTT